MRGLMFAIALVFACAPMAAAQDGVTPKTTLVQDAASYADWMSRALSSSGYKADFSLASLKDVDRFFDDQAPQGEARPGGLLSQQLGARLFGIGAYVGEVVRRKCGGHWEGDDNDPQGEINISLHLPDGSVIWPVQRAMKRFRNGSEDGIAFYGAALACADTP